MNYSALTQYTKLPQDKAYLEILPNSCYENLSQTNSSDPKQFFKVEFAALTYVEKFTVAVNNFTIANCQNLALKS